MSELSYCIDSNILIDLVRLMPRDVWEGPWAELENLALSNRAYMPRDVYLELKRVDDECAPWAEQLNGFICELSLRQIEIAQAITDSYPDWVTQEKNGADPIVIAAAAELDLTVITNERRNGPNPSQKNLRIPTVAAEFDVPCLNFVGLARHEGWKF